MKHQPRFISQQVGYGVLHSQLERIQGDFSNRHSNDNQESPSTPKGKRLATDISSILMSSVGNSNEFHFLQLSISPGQDLVPCRGTPCTPLSIISPNSTFSGRGATTLEGKSSMNLLIKGRRRYIIIKASHHTCPGPFFSRLSFSVKKA
jgi:hypothetical protein